MYFKLFSYVNFKKIKNIILIYFNIKNILKILINILSKREGLGTLMFLMQILYLSRRLGKAI